ncbi:dimethylargininase [Salinibacterium sedimenticola]|uniref:dimethylargininase n=1 Tax=Homoserinimonas sedimenticola TaxID=2986805 RepID=UPI0027E2D5AB|nr:dimethylargininase [Salinibacterium sedimenticola]
MAYPSPHVSLSRRILGALATGASVALSAHVATVFAFFVAAGANPEVFASLGAFFQNSALLAFVLLSLAGALEAFARWYIALPVALAVATASAYFGTLLGVLAEGATLNGATTDYLAASLVGPNLVFIIASGIFGSTLGVAVWRAVSGAPVERTERRIALVRLPASTLAEGQVTHIERSEVDPERADRQWESYVGALDSLGWEVVEVPVAEGYADSVFVEDTVAVFGDVAVIGAAGHESRVGEPEAVETVLRGLRLHIERIESPGTLEGGDVLKVGNTVYVGSSGRTNAEGIRQLRRIVEPRGYQVVAVPVTKALHLKTAVTALPDGTIIGYPPFVDEPSLFSRFLPVPEAEGAAVVVLDRETVLISESAQQTATLLEGLGYTVVTVDISEFEKLEGCVTCLSVRIR